MMSLLGKKASVLAKSGMSIMDLNLWDFSAKACVSELGAIVISTTIINGKRFGNVYAVKINLKDYIKYSGMCVLIITEDEYERNKSKF